MLRERNRLLLPIRRHTSHPQSITVFDAGVDLTLYKTNLRESAFLLLKCDGLSLFDKRLAPRLLTKAGCADVFVAYENLDGVINFFAYSKSVKRALLPTSAYVLARFCDCDKIKSDKLTFDVCRSGGQKYLSVQI